MAVAPSNQIGVEVSISAATPATFDESGVDALTFTEIEGIISVPELGDTTETISVNQLKEGRTTFTNGVKMFPEITIPYLYSSSDSGQVIVRAGNNGNTIHTLRIEDVDGSQINLVGYVANVVDTERSVDVHRGQSFTFRPAYAPVYSTA